MGGPRPPTHTHPRQTRPCSFFFSYPVQKSHPSPSAPRPSLPTHTQVSVRAAAAKADRPLWFPGNPAPAYLDGTLPGDYGFDPLRLGSDPDALKWFQMAEVFHGRVAMVRGRGRGERGAGA